MPQTRPLLPGRPPCLARRDTDCNFAHYVTAYGAGDSSMGCLRPCEEETHVVSVVENNYFDMARTVVWAQARRMSLQKYEYVSCL